MEKEKEKPADNSELVAALTKTLEAIALTPERIQELKKPYVDPTAAERYQRDRKRAIEDNERGLAEKKQRQQDCPHRTKDGDAIHLIHNYPDGQTRGMCKICDCLINPPEWDHKADGTAYIRPAHKDYERVQIIENSMYSAY